MRKVETRADAPQRGDSVSDDSGNERRARSRAVVNRGTFVIGSDPATGTVSYGKCSQSGREGLDSLSVGPRIDDSRDTPPPLEACAQGISRSSARASADGSDSRSAGPRTDRPTPERAGISPAGGGGARGKDEACPPRGRTPPRGAGAVSRAATLDGGAPMTWTHERDRADGWHETSGNWSILWIPAPSIDPRAWCLFHGVEFVASFATLEAAKVYAEAASS